MRYTIGSTIEDKMLGKKTGGYYVLGPYHEFILSEWGERQEKISKESNHTHYQIPVFDDIETATIYAQSLARSYRRDDVAIDCRKKSRKIRHFFPVKLDSSNFPYVIGDKAKDGDRKLSRNRFNKEVKPRGAYAYHYLIGPKDM